MLLVLILGVAIFYITQNNKAESVRTNVPDLHSKQAILMNLKNEKVIFEVGANKIIYPASLTKIMTAILAIEYFDDLNTTLQINGEMLQDLEKQNASVAGFKAGESVTVKDLLYGTLLASGADATTTLANAISGNEKNFAEMMNDKAIILKMNNTHFVNASGLHDDQHYSTVNDMAKLLTYALDNKAFKKIFTTEKYLTSTTLEHPQGLVIQNSIFNKVAKKRIGNWRFLGGKTGYTPEAGICLASYAKKGNRSYILITVGAKLEASSIPYHVEDAISIYSWL